MEDLGSIFEKPRRRRDEERARLSALVKNDVKYKLEEISKKYGTSATKVLEGLVRDFYNKMKEGEE